MQIILQEITNRDSNKISWRNIKRVLDLGNFSSPHQLIIPYESPEGEILEENIYKKDEIHNSIINHNIKHYSTPEIIPFGMGKFLYHAIGPHASSDFCERALKGNMTEEDKQDVKFEEAYNLLEHMRRQVMKEKTRSDADYIIDSIDEV